MQSLRYLYRIGKGPSSSHTMGPLVAAKRFLELAGDADKIKVILYGSLAKTGKGHMTDTVIREAFEPIKTEIVFDKQTRKLTVKIYPIDQSNLPYVCYVETPPAEYLNQLTGVKK